MAKVKLAGDNGTNIVPQNPHLQAHRPGAPLGKMKYAKSQTRNILCCPVIPKQRPLEITCEKSLL